MLENVIGLTLPTRAKQAYGAACIVKFCAVRGIESPLVDELVAQLLSVLRSTDLPEWDTHLYGLAIAGQHDGPLPKDFVAAVGASDLEAFQSLTDAVVEIGGSDMYGADTAFPFRYMMQAKSILQGLDITPPSLEELCRIAPDLHGWGKPLSPETAAAIQTWCKSQARETQVLDSI
jgi:hypothetical protein